MKDRVIHLSFMGDILTLQCLISWHLRSAEDSFYVEYMLHVMGISKMAKLIRMILAVLNSGIQRSNIVGDRFYYLYYIILY